MQSSKVNIEHRSLFLFKLSHFFPPHVQTDRGVPANRWGDPACDPAHGETDPICDGVRLLHHGLRVHPLPLHPLLHDRGGHRGMISV